MMDKPVFGEKEAGVQYSPRYAAYIIVEEKNKLALIEAPNGAYFLPGGEIEAMETKEAALKRELLEEMGIVAEIATYLGKRMSIFIPITVRPITITQATFMWQTAGNKWQNQLKRRILFGGSHHKKPLKN